LAQGENQIRRRNSTKITPRLHRLAYALLSGPRTVRELTDIIPTNNPAEYVRQLRAAFGLAIDCERIESHSQNPESRWYGRYYLTAVDREKLSKALAESRGE